MPTDPLEEKILNRIPWAVLIAAAVFGILAVLVFDPLTGLIFFAGGALAALGFIWLKRSLSGVLLREKPRALRSGILLYAARFVLLLGAFLLIILFYPKKILAFAAGFSTVIPVFLAEVALALARMKQWKD
jgi:hypothetical protein